MADEQKPPQAASVSFDVCGCPNVHLTMKDKDGKVLATAAFSPSDWISTGDTILNALQARFQANDTIGECVGHG